MRKFLTLLFVFIAIDGYPPVAISATPLVLECPQIMAHTPVKEKYPGWTVYSNDPVRLTGADITFVTRDQEDGSLDPDQVVHLNDSNLSVVSVFRLLKHHSKAPFSLVCHYGVHAELIKAIPYRVKECAVVHHMEYGAGEGEFTVSCK